MRTEIKFAGFGGQGIILLGHIFGKSVALNSGLFASFTQSYGPEARGGACSANVIIEDKFVSYPGITKLNFIVLMSQESYSVYKKNISNDTVIVIDEDLVKIAQKQENCILKIPAVKIATELGKKIAANIVMLGYFTAVSKIIDKDVMLKTVVDSVPESTRDLNIKAFESGYNWHKTAVSAKGGSLS